MSVLYPKMFKKGFFGYNQSFPKQTNWFCFSSESFSSHDISEKIEQLDLVDFLYFCILGPKMSYLSHFGVSNFP